MTKHLASFNVARAKHAAGSPEMAEFESNLARVNALGDAADGFVWRLDSGAEGVALTSELFDDPQLLLNLVVFEDIGALFDFTFKTIHKKVMNRSANVFDTHQKPYHVMWWVEAGTRPTMADCKARLDQLQAKGPSPQAFTWAQPFDEDGAPLQSFVPSRVSA